MNKVSLSLIIFLSNFCIIASSLNQPLLADNSTTTPTTDEKTVLKGGAQDAEKMQKSIKLMVPDPLAPRYSVAPQPSQFQTGVRQSELFQRSAELQERATALRAAALQKQQAEAEHQAALQRHFNINAEIHSMPPGMPLPWPRPMMPNTFGFSQPLQGDRNRRRNENVQIQVDPWTDVVAVPYRQKKLAELQTAIQQLHSVQALTPKMVTSGQLEPSAERPAQALKAVEMMLPMAPAPKDWDDWYKRVASAIYDRWKQNTAGPGTSVVLITVYASRDVDCRVTNFTEAVGAERNSAEESRFKQVSLQCVDGLSGDEVWQFPAVKPLPPKIVFDMEFKHVVGEDSGCRIVHLHNDLPPQTAP